MDSHTIDRPALQPRADWSRLMPPGLLHELQDNALLRDCRAGTAPMSLLRRLLVQHQHYSCHFTRYLCAAMSSVAEPRALQQLTHNLIEELGLDQPGRVTHAELFRRCMAACGARPGSEAALPETEALVAAMYWHCRSGDALRGMAALCLGAEAIVPTLYGSLMQGLYAVGATTEDLEFFRLHVEEDEEHALVMARLIDDALQQQPERIAEVHEVATEMVRLRLAMLDAVADTLGSR